MIGGLITASGNGWKQFINGTNIGGPVLPVGQAPTQSSKIQKGGKTRLKRKKIRKRKSRKHRK